MTRPQLPLRATVATVAVGVLGSMTYLGASVLAAADSDAAAAGAGVRLSLHDTSLAYGQALVASGRIGGGQAGEGVDLQFRDAGAPAFHTVRHGRTTTGGRFRLASSLRRSGVVRVVQATAAQAASGPSAAAASADRAVRVGADITTRRVRKDVLAGRTASFSGALRPGGRARRVALQLRRAGHWSTVARAKTGARGRFALRYRARSTGSHPARVRFSGDRGNASARQALGQLNVYRTAFASAYGPGLYGNVLGCGGHLSTATLGVANKTLPCGTKLTLRYHGRSIRVSVVDRGPFVAGREFDLTWATKQRLHFPGLGRIQTTQ